MIYTANVADYAELHTAWMKARDHAGIIARVYQQLDVREQIRRLDAVLTEYEGQNMTDVFIYL